MFPKFLQCFFQLLFGSALAVGVGRVLQGFQGCTDCLGDVCVAFSRFIQGVCPTLVLTNFVGPEILWFGTGCVALATASGGFESWLFAGLQFRAGRTVLAIACRG
jgi:hypothetical protein